jgi:hypothetical protein
MLKRILLGAFVLFILVVLSLGVLSLSESQIPAAIFGGGELASPSDWIKQEEIFVFPDKVLINVKNATWAGFTNTNSMDPFIDENSHAIEILPEDPNLIDIGDVISYKTSYGVVIHRVIAKGIDSKGIYYKVKGDNNSLQDPLKVRYEDIKGVVVAVIY